jgi:hypothetical protein
MAVTHVPGTGIGPGDARGRRRAAVIAAVVLAVVAIAVPFGIRGLDHDATPASASVVHGAGGPSAPTTTHHHRASTDSALGSHRDLPRLLPAAGSTPGLADGQTVRVGDITQGTVRRTPAGAWQVVVRWAGRWQALPVRSSAGSPVSLGRTSWVSASGLLYTRVPTATPGRFRVFSWDPQGSSAYTPPTLLASPVGLVCFDAAFTAYGNCRH